MVFLEIPNMQFGTVFANPVTYYLYHNTIAAWLGCVVIAIIIMLTSYVYHEPR